MRAAFGVCFIIFIVGLLGVATGGGSYNEMPVEQWAYLGIAIVGFLGCFWHWIAIKREKSAPKAPKPTLDEQCIQAKADLDRMYFREHGKMPEWPGKEEEEKEKV